MRLNQVTVPSTNVARAVAFYKKLGLHLIVDASPRYVRFELPDGDSTFSIHHVEKLPKESTIILYFEEEKLEEKVQQLEKEGIQFTLPPTDQNWLWKEAHLSDPDGNKLIIYRAGKNRKNPPWRIN